MKLHPNQCGSGIFCADSTWNDPEASLLGKLWWLQFPEKKTMIGNCNSLQINEADHTLYCPGLSRWTSEVIIIQFKSKIKVPMLYIRNSSWTMQYIVMIKRSENLWQLQNVYQRLVGNCHTGQSSLKGNVHITVLVCCLHQNNLTKIVSCTRNNIATCTNYCSEHLASHWK